jgi:hypothetical protein
MILKEVEHVATTGPIDDPVKHDAGDCPKCKQNSLWHYPEQKGWCHSGLFMNRWAEHYGCDNPDCCAIFVEGEF